MWKEYYAPQSQREGGMEGEVIKKEWQVALAGCLFFALGIGNMITTLQVYCSRLRRQKQFSFSLKKRQS
jgi:hypothetical protein